MNTREAVKKYGMGAVVAAVAAHIRLVESPFLPPHQAASQALYYTNRSLAADHDGPYEEVLDRMMQARSKSRGEEETT